MSRARQAAQETAALALAVSFFVERALLRVGVLDDREVERSPFLYDVVLRGEGRGSRKLFARLFQISDFAEVGKGFGDLGLRL